LSDGRATGAHDWFSIRSWAGSENRAFEELCYQLRDPAAPGWLTVKTAAPDGGVEWYDKAPDGRCHGNQVKYVRTIDDLLSQARHSAAAVGANRRDRNVVRLVFWVPIDLPDPAHRIKDKLVEGARKRWDDAVVRWKRDLPGLDDVEIDLRDSGQLLERLLKPGNEGRRWFFFEQHALGPEWFGEQLEVAKSIAHDRYTPEHHVPLPISSVFDGCCVTPGFLQRLRNSADALAEALPGDLPVAVGLPDGDESVAQLRETLSRALGELAGQCAVLRDAAAQAGPAGLPAAGMAEGAARVLHGLYEVREDAQQLGARWREATRAAGQEEDGSRAQRSTWTESIAGGRRERCTAAGGAVQQRRGQSRGGQGVGAARRGRPGQDPPSRRRHPAGAGRPPAVGDGVR